MEPYKYIPELEMYRIVIRGRRYFIHIIDFHERPFYDMRVFFCPLMHNCGRYFHMSGQCYYWKCIMMADQEEEVFHNFCDMLRLYHLKGKKDIVGKVLYHMVYRYFGDWKDNTINDLITKM